MNRVFVRMAPLIAAAIAVAAVAIYFAIRLLFGDPLEDIARKQAAGPIFLLEQYIDLAPADEWLVRLNKVREVSGFNMELIPLSAAQERLPPREHALLQQGGVVLDIGSRTFYRRVDLKGDRYVGSDEDVLQVSRLPIDIGLELKTELLRYLIVALCVLIPLGIWSRAHWRELLALSKVADSLGEGRLSARAATNRHSALQPLAVRMNQMAVRIEGLLDAQKSLLHSVSHELRTPISRIEFGLELLRDAPAGPQRETRIQSMEEDVHELKALVNELLRLAQMDGQQGLQSAPFDLAQALRECAQRSEHAFSGKRLECVLETGLEAWTGDRRLLVRAVDNLLLNAANYARQNVRLSASRIGNEALEIAVEDDGPGVPAEERERIFEAFYRLDRSRDRATGGFGLGLAIARKAVSLHGGTLAVETSSLGGARFVMRLPVLFA
ncbi:ATP-binding protein [Noviherbaspirillum malthae]|uniref:ATP-binding protein n=1 Tax=Noviherbaspirillum malthae TaxID=1260987 RepID=UPI00188EC631|nr:ATP-binding protein [Noviherbaspirillum malthae]